MIRTLTPLLAAAALIGACSPDSGPPEEPQTPAAVAPAASPSAAGAAAEAPPPSTGAVAQAPAAAPGSRPTPGAMQRCGWLHNPTPGNWWLIDSQGEHILATQGGDQAPGMDEMPDMSTEGWVETNGSYGYGCACITVTLDPGTQRVTQISGAAPQPLKHCRDDPRLPRP